jgi:uncharacterized FlgJ-related protein
MIGKNFFKMINENKILLYNKRELLFKDFPLKKTINMGIITLILTLSSICYISYIVGMKVGENKTREEIMKNLSSYEKLSIIVDVDEFTEEKFIEMLKHLNVKFPHIVMGQAIIESGFGSSILYKTNYNLFGMKEALVRPNHHSGTRSGHALYNTWRESVYDYLYWQLYTGAARLKTDDEYYQFLKESGYAENPDYIDEVRKVVLQRKLKELF